MTGDTMMAPAGFSPGIDLIVDVLQFFCFFPNTGMIHYLNSSYLMGLGHGTLLNSQAHFITKHFSERDIVNQLTNFGLCILIPRCPTR